MVLLILLAATSPAGAQDEDGATGAASEDREILLPIETDDDAVPEPSGDIDEMVVRATGRDDFLKDLSISQTSFSAAEIKSLRIQNIADLAEYTPNLEINTRSAASNPTLFIRGIGLKDYNANAAGAVAVYQDGININSPAIQLGQLFDTEELFVLRGPQGSLNGRNATAGAIMINSVLPDGELDVSGSVSYGNYNSLNVEGAIGFPIVEDLLSSRVSFTANFRDGTTKNNCANWDPEEIDMHALTEETIRAAWAFNGYPNHFIDSPTRDFPNPADPGNPIHHTKNAADEGHPHVQGSKPIKKIGTFPIRSEAAADRELAADGHSLIFDHVCIWEDPGFLEFKNSGIETWVPSGDGQVPETFAGLDRYVNNIKNWATRGLFRFQPDVNDGMDWVLNFHGGQNLGDSARLQMLGTEFFHEGGVDSFFKERLGDPTEAAAARNSHFKFEGTRVVDGLFTVDEDKNIVPGGEGGGDVDAGFYDLDGLEKLNSWGGNLRGFWDTGPVVVTSLTGYEWYERRIEDEGDAVPIKAFPAVYEDSAWQVSQELRVEGEGERYRWLVGGFFLYDELESVNLFPGINTRRIEQFFNQQLTSAAGYANGRYWLLDEVYFDAGIRYNYEHKEFALASTIEILSTGGAFTSIPEDTATATWTAPTGEAVLAWQPGGDWMYDARLDHLNLYVKYGRGMKGGHFNAGLTTSPGIAKPQRIETVDPEFIDSIELGFKSRWFQNRLVLNFAAFRYWYKDLQVFDIINEFQELPVQHLVNSDARVLGAELEIQARPLPGLLVQFGGGWLDSEFLDFKVTKAVGLPRSQGGAREFDYSGHPLISAPTWSFSSVVEYQIPLGRWGSLVPQYTVSYRSKVYLDPQKIDPISQEPFWLHNARLAYRTPDGRFEIAGWVENFLDQRYKDDVFDLSLGQETILEVWNEPRMFGFTLSAYF